MAKLRIAILFGGASKDYSVSLQSAYSVITQLSEDKFDIMPIGITKAGRWLYFPGSYHEIRDGSWEQNSDNCSAIISPDPHHGGIIKILDDGDTSFSRIDVIFSLLHGKYGECGRIQSLCKLSRIPFVGSDYDAANACTDKVLTHLILDKDGISTPKYCYIDRNFNSDSNVEIAEIERTLGYPAFVKAASCSSSFGANYVENRDELEAALKIAFSHDHKAIIEQPVVGRSFECLVYGNEYHLEVSAVAEIIADAEEGNDYIESTAHIDFPALDTETRTLIESTAKRAFKSLDCKALAKISFVLTDDTLLCTKVSHLPGFASSSMLSIIVGKDGGSEFLENIIERAIESYS